MQRILFCFFSCLSFISFGQYCTSGGPTTTVDSNVESVLINGDAGAINIPDACPGVVGVQNHTNLSVTLGVGSNYDLIVQFGTCGGNYAGYGEAWIDYNSDGAFDISESLGTWQGTPPASITTFNFTVPVGVTSGITRMRIMHREGNTSLPLDPCASYSWGSVMDFSVNLTGGIDCSAYLGDEMSDAIVIPTLPFADSNDNSYCYSNQNPVYNSPDIFYRLIPANNVGSITASVCGAGFDSFISAVTPSGQVIAFNDDDPNCGDASVLTFSPINYDTIFLVVEGWGSASGDFVLNVNSSLVGVGELTNDIITISPNPANSHIQLGNYNGPIEIVDISGKTVHSSEYVNGEKLPVHNIVNGAYFIRMKSGDKTISKKLIIQK